jgi:hypothetical protein
MKSPVDPAAARARARSSSRFEPNRCASAPGCDAGFGRDLGERELTWGKAIRRAMGGGEDLLVTDFSGARAHKRRLDVSKRSYSLKLNANVV